MMSPSLLISLEGKLVWETQALEGSSEEARTGAWDRAGRTGRRGERTAGEKTNAPAPVPWSRPRGTASPTSHLSLTSDWGTRWERLAALTWQGSVPKAGQTGAGHFSCPPSAPRTLSQPGLKSVNEGALGQLWAALPWRSLSGSVSHPRNCTPFQEGLATNLLYP